MHIKIKSTGEVLSLNDFYVLHPNKTFGGLPTDKQLSNLDAEYCESPAVVPVSVNMCQARLALLNIGITDEIVKSILETLPEPDKSKAKIEWEFRPMVERQNILVLTLGVALNLDSQTLDELFILAKTL